MKARFENGIIVLYNELPTTFKSLTGMVLSGYETLSEEIHQADGFFDVVVPEFDYYTQYLSAIFFSQDKNIFTYNVLEMEFPIPKPQKTTLTPLEFLNRFTDDEGKSILSLSRTNLDVELWWIKYNKATYINLNDPQTIAGVQALEQSGIIGPGRAVEILKVD